MVLWMNFCYCSVVMFKNFGPHIVELCLHITRIKLVHGMKKMSDRLCHFFFH